jgi:hypothetical protein
MTPETYSLRQWCEVVGASRRTAYRAIANGVLRTVMRPGANRDWHFIVHADWEDFFNRRQTDRLRLKRPHLRVPVTPCPERAERVASLQRAVAELGLPSAA